MDVEEFAATYPTAFHMADAGAWTSIQRHGLLSTRAMVDLYGLDPDRRASVLSKVRSASVRLEDDELGVMTVRDQKPLKFVDACLEEGVTRQDFLDALNSRVFFWLSADRLQRLLKARAYQRRPHLVLYVDTAALLNTHGSRVQLAPYNTGSAHVPQVPKRGPEVFVDLEKYPFDYWRRKRGKRGELVVELTVPDSVPAVATFVTRVEKRQGGDLLDVVFEA